MITIYTKTYCVYCRRAKELLDSKGAAYSEINLLEEDRFDEMVERSGGRRTVPQIFIEGKHIGGCDELLALERRGELERLLGAEQPSQDISSDE